MKNKLTKNEINKLAEVLVDKSIPEAKDVLSFFSESEREALVEAVFEYMHKRRAERARRTAPQLRAQLFSPRIRLNLKEVRSIGKTYVKRGSKIFSFDSSERAFAFCECCRKLDEIIAIVALSKNVVPRVKLTPVSTYRKNWGEPIKSLYPSYATKKVTICIETK